MACQLIILFSRQNQIKNNSKYYISF